MVGCSGKLCACTSSRFCPNAHVFHLVQFPSEHHGRWGREWMQTGQGAGFRSRDRGWRLADSGQQPGICLHRRLGAGANPGYEILRWPRPSVGDEIFALVLGAFYRREGQKLSEVQREIFAVLGGTRNPCPGSPLSRGPGVHHPHLRKSSPGLEPGWIQAGFYGLLYGRRGYAHDQSPGPGLCFS